MENTDWTAEPAPRPVRIILWAGLALFVAAITWSWHTELDVIASAQGRLVTRSSLQIVQPAETGIVRDILVKEGEPVKAGQVIARMDAKLSEADRRQIGNEIRLRQMQLRRIQAELSGVAMQRNASDAPELYAQVQAQFLARRQAHLDNVATERAVLARTEQDLRSAIEVESKLKRTLPIYRQQEQAIDDLTRDGFAGRLMLLDRQRDRIEQEQQLSAQQFNIASLKAAVSQANQKLAHVQSTYRQSLQNERVETEASASRLKQDSDKLAHRHELLELKAPHDGVIKDLATRTIGSVVAAGTVLMTVVPANEPLHAEVWITHQDAGFIESGQRAKLKLAAYPFHKFGLIEGSVTHVSPDASELPQAANVERRRGELEHVLPASGYRALVELGTKSLEHGGRTYKLAPGMQVSAEVHLGTRSVLEYLLAPVRRTVHEAAREP